MTITICGTLEWGAIPMPWYSTPDGVGELSGLQAFHRRLQSALESKMQLNGFLCIPLSSL